MDLAVKKRVLRYFTYGLYAVSAHSGEADGVFLANWLSQCSFDPPLLMVSVQNDSRTGALISASGQFAVHVLASGQRELAGMLGKTSITPAAKLARVRWHPSPLTGCPILEDALGYVECRVTGQLPAGDSVVVIGEVIDAQVQNESDLAPLTMREAGFHHSG